MENQAAGEGQGRSEMEFTDIETISECFESACIFHVVIDILGFVLFMHQQIPSVLQDMNLEFDELQQEFKGLEMVSVQEEMKAPLRRKHMTRKREVKQGIRRMEKLMTSVNQVKTSLQSLITEVPDIEKVSLVLGPSPLRPLHVYELWFSCGKVVSVDFNRSRVTEALSKKVAFSLIDIFVSNLSFLSKSFVFSDAIFVFLLSYSYFSGKGGTDVNLQGCWIRQKCKCRYMMECFLLQCRDLSIVLFDSLCYLCQGPSKLFLLVKAPSSLNVPSDFLPKHDFRCPKKIVPFKLRFKCRKLVGINSQCNDTHCIGMNDQCDDHRTNGCDLGSPSNNFIWFQCRHVIKGLSSKGSSNEE